MTTTGKFISRWFFNDFFVVYTPKWRFFGILHKCDSGVWQYLDVYNYAIVILDLNLPDTNGYDILQKIRNHKKLSVKNIPVLILSGYAQLDNKLKGLSLGADDYLTKPFSTAELLMRIETIIRRSTTQSTSVIKINF